MPTTRRRLIQLAGLAALARAESSTSLFDGRTLNGWLQIENNAISLSASNIIDPAAFASKLAGGGDDISVFLRSKLRDPNAPLPALVKEINQLIAGPRFLPRALDDTLQGYELARAHKKFLENAYPKELAKSDATGWIPKDGAMASTGSGRGVIYTAKDYGRFRLTFTMRHVSGNPDHQACVLIFCTRPEGGALPLDALGGIQFQVPNGGHWDYRPGMNNNGGAKFTSVTKTSFDAHQWSGVEIVADASRGTARMAVSQPPGGPAVEVLDFKDPSAGKAGPIAWQMHNAGLFDEYKDVTIEADPKSDELIRLTRHN
jgi:Domain of Unknown Function (DUF1080)